MRNRRRSILVEGFQGRFVATQVAWLSVCFALFVAVLIGPLVWAVNSSAASPGDVTWAADLLQLHNRLWIPLLALFLGVAWTMVRQSHRVAGPLYRFRRVFAQVAGGDLGVRVRVRDGDYLVPESEAFDSMIGAVRDRVRRAQEAAGVLRRDLDALTTSTDRVSVQEIAALAARAAETDEILKEFVTGAAVAAELALSAPRKPAKLALSVTQVLLIVFISLCCLAAMAAPLYTFALDRARVSQTAVHASIGTNAAPK